MLKSSEIYTDIIKIWRSTYTRNYLSEKLATAVAHLLMKEKKVKMGPGSDIKLMNNSMQYIKRKNTQVYICYSTLEYYRCI